MLPIYSFGNHLRQPRGPLPFCHFNIHGYLNFIKGHNFPTNYDSGEMKTAPVPQNNLWLNRAKTLPYHFIVFLKKNFFISCRKIVESHVIIILRSLQI